MTFPRSRFPMSRFQGHGFPEVTFPRSHQGRNFRVVDEAVAVGPLLRDAASPGDAAAARPERGRHAPPGPVRHDPREVHRARAARVHLQQLTVAGRNKNRCRCQHVPQAATGHTDTDTGANQYQCGWYKVRFPREDRKFNCCSATITA